VSELVQFISDPHANELIIEDRINLRDPLLTLKPALMAHSKLTHLSLSDCSLEDESVAVIADIMKSNNQLKSIDLPNNLIGPQGAAYLMDGLIENQSVTRLTLDNNQLKDEGAQRLAAAVQLHPNLVELNLVGNAIGDAGVTFLCKSLILSQLKRDAPHVFPVVNLAHNLVGDAGCAAIADLVIKNPTVRRLNLDHNIIADEGLKSLSRAISATNTQVKGVYLACNQISSKGLISLSQALKSITGEIVVDLSDNKLVSRSGIGAIVDPDLSLDYKLLKVFKPSMSGDGKSVNSRTCTTANVQKMKESNTPTTSSEHSSGTSSPTLDRKPSLSNVNSFQEKLKDSTGRRVSFSQNVLVASPSPAAHLGLSPSRAGQSINRSHRPSDDDEDDDDDERISNASQRPGGRRQEYGYGSTDDELSGSASSSRNNLALSKEEKERGGVDEDDDDDEEPIVAAVSPKLAQARVDANARASSVSKRGVHFKDDAVKPSEQRKSEMQVGEDFDLDELEQLAEMRNRGR